MIIPARFNGPPDTGNGGYCAGTFADAVLDAGTGGSGTGGSGTGGSGTGGSGAGGVVEVTLRIPPPLDTALSIVDRRIQTVDGVTVADVAPAGPIDTVVPPVGYLDAVAASTRYPGFTDHPFPTCFVCGPDKADGLRIFPGRLADDTTAAPWTVPADVSPAIVWAALDCPGGWAVIAAGRPYVLGRMAVQVDQLPQPGDQCVVRGALADAEGRKARVHTTLYGPDGTILARARATWIALAGT
jgi:hypothetical protein